jgi:hypothetical protein
VTKLSDSLLNFVTQRKMKFCGLGIGQGQYGFDQCLGPICTDFNTEKSSGVMLRSFDKKICPKVWWNYKIWLDKVYTCAKTMRLYVFRVKNYLISKISCFCRQCSYNMTLTVNPASTENFFFNFGLILWYVSPLDTLDMRSKRKIFCQYRKYDF